jgi:cellulose synthase/poly-beta-1,6-N-acetylglucosamine synthase-like glycosyltransferase
VFSYLTLWVSYLFVFAIAGRFYHQREKQNTSRINKYALVIPCYKEGNVLLKSIKANLEVNFPKERFKIFVAADSLDNDVLRELRSLPIEVLAVRFKNPTKAKAVNAVLKCINRHVYTHTIVLDADNVMRRDYLREVDKYISKEDLVVQTHRMAMNSDSNVAVLDGINEEIGNHIFRKGHSVMGLSAALIGSGMVFKTWLFKEMMAPIQDTAGEDKMLEFALLRKKIKVPYLESAVVFDQKVSQVQQYYGQRQRWIAARFYFLKKELVNAFGSLLKGDLDFFNKWLQFFLPQKIVLITSVFAFSLTSVFLGYNSSLSLLLLLMLCLTFALSIPARFYNKHLLGAIFKIPVITIQTIKILMNIYKVDPGKFNVTPK